MSYKEIETIINKMKCKSCKSDLLPTWLIKKHLLKFLSVITEIVNLSLNSGVFVEDWKCAIIRPLIKKKNITDLKNYRPVSNLQFISKVVECAMLKQITEHCDRLDLHPDFQSAYRKNHSCETSLVYIVNKILWTLENSEIKILTCLDLSAAFDTVDHQVLLDVFNNYYGVGGVAPAMVQIVSA